MLLAEHHDSESGRAAGHSSCVLPIGLAFQRSEEWVLASMPRIAREGWRAAVRARAKGPSSNCRSCAQCKARSAPSAVARSVSESRRCEAGPRAVGRVGRVARASPCAPAPSINKCYRSALDRCRGCTTALSYPADDGLCKDRETFRHWHCWADQIRTFDWRLGSLAATNAESIAGRGGRREGRRARGSGAPCGLWAGVCARKCDRQKRRSGVNGIGAERPDSVFVFLSALPPRPPRPVPMPA